MEALSWIYRRLTQNEFKAINDQIQSEGGGSQTYIDLPTGKISNENLNSFFGEGEPYGKGYKWEVPIFSLSLSTPAQNVTISARAENRNCIREQNKDKRINIWKSEYSSFPSSTYNETDNPIYIFILKTTEGEFYAGWFYAKQYSYDWFLVKDLCQPFLGESTGYVEFQTPIQINKEIFYWPFIGLSQDKKHIQ